MNKTTENRYLSDLYLQSKMYAWNSINSVQKSITKPDSTIHVILGIIIMIGKLSLFGNLNVD
jgi:hypothetical protein